MSEPTHRAFVFPGQGSQAVGMGKALADAFGTAREVFEEVDEALGQSLTKLMWEGPGDELTLTENAQPAIMAVSLAAARVLESEGNFALGAKADFVAGHSLGEYSALAAVGALKLADTARLLTKRGQAMQAAVPVGEGAMAALLGPSAEQVEELIAAASGGDVLTVANDNAPGQIVISGAKSAIDRAVEIAKERKDLAIKKAMPLAVSAPFHCPLMQPAADAMAEALEGVTFAPPAVPVIANVTAEPVADPNQIRKLLVEQVTARVRWRETIASLPGLDVSIVVEVGAGKVLSGMNKRISRDLNSLNVDTPEDVEAILKSL